MFALLQTKGSGNLGVPLKKEPNNYLEADKNHVPQHLEFNLEIIPQASHLLTSVKLFS